MDASDPRHGTYAGAVAHWFDSERPCARCYRAETRYRKNRKLKHLNGVPVTIPAIGINRRLQALQALGWTGPQIAAEAGMSLATIRSIGYHHSQAVHARTAEAVVAAYERLCMTRPEGGYARRARGMAARNGYVPPLAWDDIDNDPRPTGVFAGTTRDRQGPSGDSVDHARVERLLAGEWTLASEATRSERQAVLARWPGTLNDLERLTGWRTDRYHLPRGAA